jgi:hypothetical protein
LHIIQASAPPVTFRYSGHGTFPCRYTWLPKVVRQLLTQPTLFEDEDDAMMRLGVGKNMVRAIKFWAESAGVISQISSRGNAYEVTQFGQRVFGPGGFDEYLEDIQTLWLIHWNLSTRVREAPFAWYYLINHWHRTDFTKPEVLAAFEQETRREDRVLSPVTLDEHCSIFIRCYVTPTGGKQAEDALDCPLNELGLLEEVGERPDADSGRREPIYAFRVEDKGDLSPALFTYCLHDFWATRHANEKTLAARQIAGGVGSPGQVFKLPEHTVRERLETIARDSAGVFEYQESASIQQVTRRSIPTSDTLLRRVYGVR